MICTIFPYFSRFVKIKIKKYLFFQAFAEVYEISEFQTKLVKNMLNRNTIFTVVSIKSRTGLSS